MDCRKPRTVSKDTAECPGCGANAREVKVRTIKHWLLPRFVPLVPQVLFYFCKGADCSIVYFSRDGSVRYTKDELRHPVGIKESDGSFLICYCFGVTAEMIAKEVREKGESPFSVWIAGETRKGNCACDVRNPSGRCCLQEIKRVEDMHATSERR